MKLWTVVSCSCFYINPNAFSVLQKPGNWPCCSNTFGGDCMTSLKYQLSTVSKHSQTWSNHVEYGASWTGQPAASCFKNLARTVYFSRVAQSIMHRDTAGTSLTRSHFVWQWIGDLADWSPHPALMTLCPIFVTLLGPSQFCIDQHVFL